MVTRKNYKKNHCVTLKVTTKGTGKTVSNSCCTFVRVRDYRFEVVSCWQISGTGQIWVLSSKKLNGKNTFSFYFEIGWCLCKWWTSLLSWVLIEKLFEQTYDLTSEGCKVFSLISVLNLSRLLYIVWKLR